jgi:hypothetical protein
MAVNFGKYINFLKIFHHTVVRNTSLFCQDVTTLGTKTFSITIRKYDTQHNYKKVDTQHSDA